MTLKRYRVADKASDLPEVYTTTKIGRTQALTPEGFLLCEAVPIKRTGTMMYAPGETPIKAGKDGCAYVTRDAEALFAPEAIASYQGKPVVDDHPPEDVNPRNWKQFARGMTLNPRRGEGDNADVLLADLLITDAETIKAVQSGKREVSAGYEADYEQTGEGEGRQRNIIGNHVALVARGRCGPRCSISDHQSSALKGHTPMPKNTRPGGRVKLAAAIRASFLDAAENVAATLAGEDDTGMDDDTGSDGSTHIHIHANGSTGTDNVGDPNPTTTAPKPTDDGTMTQDDPVEARFQKIEATLDEIKKLVGGGTSAPVAKDADPGDLSPDSDTSDLADGKGDTKPGGAGIVGDSAALATEFQRTVADAAILAPGFKVPTFDAALPRAKAIDSICRLRRSALGHVAATTAGSELLGSLSDGVTNLDITNAPCADIAATFKAAAALKRASNNRSATGDAGRLATPVAGAKPTPTPADINRINQEFWKSRGVNH